MSFEKYEQLRNLIDSVSSLDEFNEELNKDIARYKIEGWKRDDYGRLYERVKGGSHYDTHFIQE
jgi:hypothetical protein